MLTDPIARIRRFNRVLTAEVGALDLSFLGRGRPLGAARLLWSISAEGVEVSALRERLRLDSGLLSRLLRGLEAEGLVTTAAAPAPDRRRRIARLTAAGQAEKAIYDRLNDEMAADMLARLAPRSDTLLPAMDRIALALTRDRIRIGAADPETPAAKACLAAYFDLLCDRIPGISRAHVPDPDPEADAFRPPSGAFLLALSDEGPVGCVCLKRLTDQRAEVKRLWVAPEARSLGLARRLMAAIEEAARALGRRELVLDTNDALPEAIALYRASGWHEIPAYTGFPATCWFGKAL